MTLQDQLQNIQRAVEKTALNTKEVLTVEEAAQYTGYEVKSIRVMMSRREIPHSKPKGSAFFSRTELDRWMLSRPVKTIMDQEAEASSYILRNKRK